MTDGADKLRIERNRERRRVHDMLVRDRMEREREVARREAELQVASGSFANLADTVIEPTAEWMAKGDTVPFTPKQPDGTVRVVRSVRRVVTPIVIRMWRAGRLSDDQAHACLWYRDAFDWSGLGEGYASSRLDPNSTIRGSRADGAAAGYIPTSQSAAYWRKLYRSAQAALTPDYLKFFEKIVLDDVAIGLATRFARCRNLRAVGIFKQQSDKVAIFLDQEGVEDHVRLSDY